MILTFHMPPQARGRDYVISIEYGSELLKKKIQNSWSWYGGVKPFFVK